MTLVSPRLRSAITEPAAGDERLHQLSPCQSCGSFDTEVFYTADGVPVNSCLMLDTRAEATAFPRGRIELSVCHACSFIGNQAFDPNLVTYSSSYEETQGFSGRFQQFVHELAARLIERHDIRGKRILEIGCGKGEFLALICELGSNQGIGIDPGYVPGRVTTTRGVSFIRDFYSARHAGVDADVICCRHTLEHIQPVRAFLQSVRDAIGDSRDTVVYFEVPDVTRILRDLAFWDVYYEHCSYFSAGSLARLFRSCDFQVTDLRRGFDDQYLSIEAVAGSAAGDASPTELGEAAAALESDVRFFADRHRDAVSRWRVDVDARLARGQRLALWGASSKAVSYLSHLQLEAAIDCVVDINPHKQGKFLAGSGQQVLSPEALRSCPPDVVVVMNPIYRDEIAHDLECLGIDAEVVAL